MSRRSLANVVRLAVCSLLALSPLAAAQEPLFTIAQISDSQPQTTAENQRFVDVLTKIAQAGQPGALLPRPVTLVLFAGDITWGNTRSEWTAAKAKLDTWLTANGIPYLAVPGNHDVDNSDTALYEEYIGNADVWNASSVAFVGQNGIARTPNWRGLRFVGFNNSNPGWNMISSTDLAEIQSVVADARAAGENVFFLCHHPHNDQSRMPLAGILPDPSAMGYMHGHSGSPHVTKGLSGVTNPNIYDFGSNAIYDDGALIYIDVYPTELRAHVLQLATNPTTLPAPVVVPLAFPLELAGEPDFGVPGPLHTGSIAAVTARTPERKAWFAQGAWFAILWSPSAGAHRIHRLDTGTGAWTDTGPTVSTSQQRAFDVLAEGGTLLVASNVPTAPGTAGNGSPGQLHRLTWDAGTQRYVATAGYPVAVNDARAPSLVLARDGAGKLWAAWTLGGSVWVNRTTTGDASWGTPFALASGLGSLDTVALASFSGQLAAVWTRTSDGSAGCALRSDGAPDTTWTTEVAAAAGGVGGTDLDLATSGGRLFAAVKAGGGGLSLLERSAVGSWTTRPLGTAADELAQPLLVVDQTFGLLRLIATGPTFAERSSSGGGAIYTKVAPLATLAFPLGRGTPLIQDGQHPSARHATSGRAPVSSSTGMTVLASVAETTRYWHAYDALVAVPPAPVADFTASVTAGPVPLVVDFMDLSSGAPTHWSWDFGDGGTAPGSSPRHTFTVPGDYTVTLRASNGFGEDVLVRSAYVHVTPPPSSIAYVPVADARVNEGSPSSNAGSDGVLRVRNQAGGSYWTYLRFDLSSLPAPATSVKLRLFCTDGSDAGGTVYPIANDTWGENTINWSNRPALPATPLASFGAVSAGFWAEVELGAGAVEQGLVSLAVAGGSSNSAYYTSRETATPPELVVTLAGGGTPPVAAFVGTPLQGPAPLAVTFTDQSTNTPTAWAWDFGDGAMSTERNPTHVYTVPGTYTVLLDVSNSAGVDSRTRLDYVVVEQPLPIQTFSPAADARVTENSATKNYGGETTLRVRAQSGGSSHSYVRFDVPSLAGPAVAAKLRFFCTDGSSNGGVLYVSPLGWTESGITWNNRPALPPSSLASLGTTVAGAWYEVDVSSVVTGTGSFAFAIAGGTSNTALYSSREGANPPQLVIETAPGGPPSASFTGAPLTGAAPLQVTFTDASAGAQSFSWTFGDGQTSTERNPVHVYTTPGVYTVTLQVSNGEGSDSLTRTDYVWVTSPPPVRTFTPIADTRANEASPTATAGTSDTLRIREAVGGSYHTYLRFDLSTLSTPILSAKLRLFSTDGSPVAGLVYPTSGSWSEATLNWNNRPGPTGALIASTGNVDVNTWAEFDVTSAVTGPGTLNLVIQSTSSNSCYYSSREGANPPELVVETLAP